MQNATDDLQPSGRSYQARMLGISAALSFAAVGIIDLYLVALLRMSASEWTRFAALVGVFFVVIFALQARLVAAAGGLKVFRGVLHVSCCPSAGP